MVETQPADPSPLSNVTFYVNLLSAWGVGEVCGVIGGRILTVGNQNGSSAFLITAENIVGNQIKHYISKKINTHNLVNSLLKEKIESR